MMEETTGVGSSSSYSTSSTLITVATCNLNQWALDFDGNVQRIYESCRLASEFIYYEMYFAEAIRYILVKRSCVTG